MRLVLLCLAGIMVMAACSGGGDAAEAPSADQPTMQPISASDGLPTPFIYDGPGPSAGTGLVYGRMLWNAQPIEGMRVVLCSGIGFFSDCEGEEYEALTGAEGVYIFTDVPVGTYGLTFQEIGGEDWFYMSSSLGLDATEFDVVDGEILDIGDFHVVKDDMVLLSPAFEEQVSQARPELSWQAYPGAAYYELTLSPDRATYYPFFGEQMTDTSATVSEDMLNCGYTWYVDAFNEQGIQIAEVRDFASFTVEGQAYDCNVTGLSPNDGANVSSDSIELSWDAHPLASYYQIYFYNADDYTAILNFVQVDGTSYTVTENVPPGNYQWVVYAYPETGFDSIAFSDTFKLVVSQ